MFGLAAAALVGLGLYGLICQPGALRRILSFNLMGSGIFLLFGVIVKRGGGALSAIAVALLMRLAETAGRGTLDADEPALTPRPIITRGQEGDDVPLPRAPYRRSCSPWRRHPGAAADAAGGRLAGRPIACADQGWAQVGPLRAGADTRRARRGGGRRRRRAVERRQLELPTRRLEPAARREPEGRRTLGRDVGHQHGRDLGRRALRPAGVPHPGGRTRDPRIAGLLAAPARGLERTQYRRSGAGPVHAVRCVGAADLLGGAPGRAERQARDPRGGIALSALRAGRLGPLSAGGGAFLWYLRHAGHRPASRTDRRPERGRGPDAAVGDRGGRCWGCNRAAAT